MIRELPQCPMRLPHAKVAAPWRGGARERCRYSETGFVVNETAVEGPLLCLRSSYLLWDVTAAGGVTAASLAPLLLLVPPPGAPRRTSPPPPPPGSDSMVWTEPRAAPAAASP